MSHLLYKINKWKNMNKIIFKRLNMKFKIPKCRLKQ